MLVVVGADAHCTIVESYLGAGDGVYFTNAVTEIGRRERVVDHYKLQLETTRAFHVSTMQATWGGARTSRRIPCRWAAPGAQRCQRAAAEGTEATLNGLYLCTAGSTSTITQDRPRQAARHQPRAVQGHSRRQGVRVFNGKILVRKDAQKTDSKQTNKNLVLSEDAVINTKPELQIYADDVRCTHGATIGQLDAEAIFYLQSRGIGKSRRATC